MLMRLIPPDGRQALHAGEWNANLEQCERTACSDDSSPFRVFFLARTEPDHCCQTPTTSMSASSCAACASRACRTSPAPPSRRRCLARRARPSSVRITSTSRSLVGARRSRRPRSASTAAARHALARTHPSRTSAWRNRIGSLPASRTRGPRCRTCTALVPLTAPGEARRPSVRSYRCPPPAFLGGETR